MKAAKKNPRENRQTQGGSNAFAGIRVSIIAIEPTGLTGYSVVKFKLVARPGWTPKTARQAFRVWGEYVPVEKWAQSSSTLRPLKGDSRTGGSRTHADKVADQIIRQKANIIIVPNDLERSQQWIYSACNIAMEHDSWEVHTKHLFSSSSGIASGLLRLPMVLPRRRVIKTHDPVLNKACARIQRWLEQNLPVTGLRVWKNTREEWLENRALYGRGDGPKHQGVNAMSGEAMDRWVKQGLKLQEQRRIEGLDG